MAEMASLSSEDVKSLYHCENNQQRRDLLIKILDYPTSDDEEEDMRSSILLDFYLESLNYASEQGFSWQQGLGLFELMKDLREKALGLSLFQATQLFKTMFKTHGAVFQPNRVTAVVDFVFSLFFNHFHLYQFVFQHERETDATSCHLTLESPSQNLLALSKGIEKSEWEKQQMLKSLELKHNENQLERQSLLDLEMQSLESLLHEQLLFLSDNETLTTDELKSIIEETVKMYVTSAGSTIKFSIQESQENLMYQFAKAAVNQENGKGKTGTSQSQNTLTVKKSSTKRKNSKV